MQTNKINILDNDMQELQETLNYTCNMKLKLQKL